MSVFLSVNLDKTNNNDRSLIFTRLKFISLFVKKITFNQIKRH